MDTEDRPATPAVEEMPVRQDIKVSAYYTGWAQTGVRALVVETPDVTYVRVEESTGPIQGMWEPSARGAEHTYATGYRDAQAEALRLVRERLTERDELAKETQR